MTFCITANQSGVTLGRLAEEARVNLGRLIVVSSFFLPMTDGKVKRVK